MEDVDFAGGGDWTPARQEPAHAARQARIAEERRNPRVSKGDSSTGKPVLQPEALENSVHEGAGAFFVAEGLLGDADFDCAGDEGGGDYQFFEGFELGLTSDDLAFIGSGFGRFDCVAAGTESCIGGGDDSLNAEWFGNTDRSAAEGVGADGAVRTLGAVGGLAGGEEEEG